MFDWVPNPDPTVFLLIFFSSSFLALCAYFFFDIPLVRRLSDLFWILIGGVGALTALLFTSYTQDQSNLQTQFIELRQDTATVLDSFGSFVDQNCFHSRPPTIRISEDHLSVACDHLALVFSDLLKNEFYLTMQNFLSDIEDIDSTEDSCMSYLNVWRSGDCKSLDAAASFGSASFEIERLKGDNSRGGVSVEKHISEILTNTFGERNAAQDYIRLLEDAELLERIALETERKYQSSMNEAWRIDARNLALFALTFVLPLRLLKTISEFPRFERLLRKPA